MARVAGNVFEVSHRGVGVIELHITEKLAELGGLLLEPGILLNDLVMDLGHFIELIDEPVVLALEPEHLGPQLI